MNRASPRCPVGVAEITPREPELPGDLVRLWGERERLLAAGSTDASLRLSPTTAPREKAVKFMIGWRKARNVALVSLVVAGAGGVATAALAGAAPTPSIFLRVCNSDSG